MCKHGIFKLQVSVEVSSVQGMLRFLRFFYDHMIYAYLWRTGLQFFTVCSLSVHVLTACAELLFYLLMHWDHEAPTVYAVFFPQP